MIFDWTINVGNVIAIVSLIVSLWGGALMAYHRIDKRLERFELKLVYHADTIGAHTTRFITNENRLIELAGDMQRVIGRIEMMRDWDGRDRRAT